VIWRWLAVMLALPMLCLVALMPEAWPMWLFAWGALAIKGFGGRPGRTRTRAK
jgi:hypothetical protein